MPATAAGWAGSLAAPWWPPDRGKHLWRPLTRLSIQLQKALGRPWGDPAWPYFAVNILLHAAVCLALYGVARRAFDPRRPGADWAAGAAALLFAAKGSG
ncbi:MAG: hypothetical protein M1457_06180, partial [bacterium]|nr:hypothetical protein [bacterium]